MRYFFFLLFLSLVGCTSSSDTPPNIVIIFADDLGYGDLGLWGAEGYSTPYLDQMEREGVRLSNFYVSSPVCSASRAALLTGSYNKRVDISGALNPHSQKGISAGEVTLAEMLKQKGYATAAVGKWHLGHLPQFLPTKNGFDSYFGIPYSNDMSPDPKNNVRERARKWPPLPLVENLETIEEEPDQSLLIERYNEKAVSFIKNNADKPFFLYYAHTMPHVPLFASEKYAGSSEQGLYGDVIQEIDGSVGAVLDALKEAGVDDNTLVIFTSDNGPWKVMGNHAGTCGPLRGRKGTTWECGIRVPFIARWPEKLPAGTASDAAAMTIDLLPTIASLTNASLPDHPIDGQNIWPVLTGASAQSPHNALYFYYGGQLQAVRYKNWKLHVPHVYRVVEEEGHDNIPGTYGFPSTGLELYNLAEDIAESNNVADQHPEMVSYLTALMDSMRTVLGDRTLDLAGREVRPADRDTTFMVPQVTQQH